MTVASEETDIHALDQETVARIAAGEVIERPASVCKELIENSLDADATRIDVAVSRGGIDAITVRDDGHGMTEAGARMAVKEHTTSKLHDAGDLQTVKTLGFRGEALHTIGAVSRMTITTKPRAQDTAGTQIEYVGGEIERVEPTGRPPGTTVEVTDLFYNTPARRKYLSEPTTEFRHISRVVGRYALATPEVAVSLSHNGSSVFATTGQGDRRSAIMNVHGREVAESMYQLDVTPEGPLDRVYGYVSDPETTRASRQYLSVYINGRYVEPDRIRTAIVNAYDRQLAADRYPFAVLFLELPSDQVDVNVHPRKLAVRFDTDDAVAETVETAIRERLREAGHLRSSAPRGQSAPEETKVTTDTVATEETSDATTTGAASNQPSHAETTGEDGSQQPPSDTHSSTHTPTQQERVESSTTTQSGTTNSADPKPATEDTEVDVTTQQTLDGKADTQVLESTALPTVRVLGQLDETYIVADAGDGLVIIDQHAADERVQYERLQAAFEEQTAVQSLATPVTLEVTPTEASMFDAIAEDLAQLGFHADRENDTVAVRTVPAVLGSTLPPERLYDAIDALIATEKNAERPLNVVAAELLADQACAPAVTGNTTLTDGEIKTLLEKLAACENPYACPHGRPTIIKIDADELATRFERDYPGHGRRKE